jgi:hypothetical protein
MIHLLASSATGPFEWFSQHIQTVAWPAIFICIWRVSKYVERISSQANKTITQIDTMSTNCIPTIQTSLQGQDKLLQSMDQHLATIADNSHRRREDHP